MEGLSTHLAISIGEGGIALVGEFIILTLVAWWIWCDRKPDITSLPGVDIYRNGVGEIDVVVTVWLVESRLAGECDAVASSSSFYKADFEGIGATIILSDFRTANRSS